jgi:hypothetical protein
MRMSQDGEIVQATDDGDGGCASARVRRSAEWIGRTADS